MRLFGAYFRANSLIVASALFFLASVLVATCGGPDFTPPCLFKLATGHSCPGCGTTRAFMAMLRLDFPAAWGYNPLAFVVLPLGVAALARDLRRFRKRQTER